MNTSYQAGFIRVELRIVTDHLARIGPSGAAVYLVLCRYADNATKTCYPSLRTISKLTGLSRPTVVKAIQILREAHLIAVVRRKTEKGDAASNLYTLLGPLANSGSEPQPGKVTAPPVGKSSYHCGKASLPELDSIKKTQQNKRECGDAAPQSDPDVQKRSRVSSPEKRRRDPNLDHPAVAAYYTLSGKEPNRVQCAAIAATVTDLPRWQAAIKKWSMVGNSIGNVEGMLEWYDEGIPERSNRNGRHGRVGGVGWESVKAGERYGGGVTTPDERSRFETEWESAPTGGCVEGTGSSPLSGVQG